MSNFILFSVDLRNILGGYHLVIDLRLKYPSTHHDMMMRFFCACLKEKLDMVRGLWYSPRAVSR